VRQHNQASILLFNIDKMSQLAKHYQVLPFLYSANQVNLHSVIYCTLSSARRPECESSLLWRPQILYTHIFYIIYEYTHRTVLVGLLRPLLTFINVCWNLLCFSIVSFLTIFLQGLLRHSFVLNIFKWSAALWMNYVGNSKLNLRLVCKKKRVVIAPKGTLSINK
jgi:hypothetical protein